MKRTLYYALGLTIAGFVAQGASAWLILVGAIPAVLDGVTVKVPTTSWWRRR